MSHIKLFLFCFCVLLSSFCYGANRTLHYEPEIVELIGTIKLITYPGPPEYDDISKGDIPETGAYLTVAFPFNVESLSNDIQKEEPEKNIKIIQLALDVEKGDWKIVKNGIKKAKHFRAKGTLYHQQNGHHHTRVLMDVKQLEILP